MGCFPLCSGSRIVTKGKAGAEPRRLGEVYTRTLLWLVSRPPCPSVFTPVQTGPWGLKSGRGYPPQGSIPGPKGIKRPTKRSCSTALCFTGGNAFLCSTVGSTRPVASCGLPCARAHSDAILRTLVPEGVPGFPPYGLITGCPPLGSQRALPVFPNDRKCNCGPWGTRGRGPAENLIGKLHTGPEGPRSPSPSSRSAAVPNGPPTWKPSWSTTSGQPGLSHITRRPNSSGPPACALPTTTKNRPCASGSTGPWAPPRAMGGSRGDRPWTIQEGPRKAQGGRSPGSTPSSPKAPTGDSGHRIAGGPAPGAPAGTIAREPSTARTTITPSPGEAARYGARTRRPATRGIRKRPRVPRSAGWRGMGRAERPMELLR